MESQDYCTFTKEFYRLMWLNLPFKNFRYLKGYISFCKRKRTDILALKVMIKNLYCWFFTKTQYAFILNYLGVLGKRCMGVFRERKWKVVEINEIRKKLLKYVSFWVTFFGEYFFIIIKWDWGKFYPKIRKWLTPTIKEKSLTYSNSSLKL